MSDPLRIRPVNVRGLALTEKQTLQEILTSALNRSTIFSDKSLTPQLATAIIENLNLNTYEGEVLPRYVASRLLLDNGFTGITTEQKDELVRIVTEIIGDDSCLRQEANTSSSPPIAHLAVSGQAIVSPVKDLKNDGDALVEWVRDIYLPTSNELHRLLCSNSLRTSHLLGWVNQVVKPIDPEFNPLKYLNNNPDSIISDTEWEDFRRALNRDFLPTINAIVKESATTFTSTKETAFGVARIIPDLTQRMRTLGGRTISMDVIQPLYGPEHFEYVAAFLDRVTFRLDKLKQFQESHKVDVRFNEIFKRSGAITFVDKPILVVSFIGSELFGELPTDEALQKLRRLEAAITGSISDSLAFTRGVARKYKAPFVPIPEAIASAILAEGRKEITNLSGGGDLAQAAERLIYIEAILKAMSKSDDPIYHLGSIVYPKQFGAVMGLGDTPQSLSESPPTGTLRVENLILQTEPNLPLPLELNSNSDEVKFSPLEEAKLFLTRTFSREIFKKDCNTRIDFYRHLGLELSKAPSQEKRIQRIGRINEQLSEIAERYYVKLFFSQEERNRNIPDWNLQ